MCYCFLHSSYFCENGNAECLTSFSGMPHKNVNTNLRIFSSVLLFFCHECLSSPCLTLSLQNFSFWNLRSAFITFAIMQKVSLEKIFVKVLHIYFAFDNTQEKMELVTAISVKLSLCKYFKGDFQVINTGDKFDCLLISEYTRTLIN